MILEQTIIVEDQTYEVSLVIESVSEFLAGNDGVAVEIQKSSTHIQWRYVGGTWINLVSLASLTGANGQEIELQASATHIQWKLVNDLIWTDLVALVDLKGEPGREIEIQKSATHIQWKYADDVVWTDLVALVDITGTDGKEVELQKTATHIQWRLTGGTWADLVALVDITGPAGADSNPLPIGTLLRASQSPGARWLAQGQTFLQSAKPLTYAQVGLLPTFSAWENVGNAVALMRNIAYGGGRFVAVQSAAIQYSTDLGLTWTNVAATGLWNAVAYSATLARWVIVSNTGTIKYSDNGGATWADATTPSFGGTAIYGVVWAGTQFVACGLGGKIATSPTGDVWTQQTSGSAELFNNVGYSAALGQVIAAGTAGTLRYSYDGVTWVQAVAPINTTLQYFAPVFCADTGVWVVPNRDCFLFSRNGIVWSRVQTHYEGKGEYLSRCATDGRRVLMSAYNAADTLVVDTCDMIPRRVASYNISAAWYGGAAYGNGIWLLCGAADNLIGRSVESYNTATSFRLPTVGLDAGICNDSYILGD